MSEQSAGPLMLWRHLGWFERILALTLVAAAAGAAWYLLPFWRESPELSHGFFALPCFLALLWQSRNESDWTARCPRLARGAHFFLVFGGVLLALVAALAALAQGPFHSQTAFLVGLFLSAFTLSAVLSLARGGGGIIRLNGASLCAVAMWWFVVPLPSGTLARFTLFLQNIITAGSLHALHLFGFAAERSGNIIKLTNTLVGVEEACSGIRSLTACLFAGVVLGGLMLPGIGRRILVVLAAAIIAIAANFARSITLCLLAANGVEIRGTWHDATAYAVLGLTAAVLFGGCLLLDKKPASAPFVAVISPPLYHRLAAHLHVAFAAITALLIGTIAFKIAPDRDGETPPPNLQSLLTFDTPQWMRRTDEAIFAFSKALNTSYLHQETYYSGNVQLTFYVAYWGTNQSTLGSVALHTPDICLPGSGWEVLPPPQASDRYPLASPRRFSFRKNTYPQHVWFWHFFDGAPIAEATGLYPWQLGPLLLKRSVSANAPQWVVRVSSNKPLETLIDEPIIQEFFARLRAAGLTGGPTS